MTKYTEGSIVVYMEKHNGNIQTKIDQTAKAFIFDDGIQGWNMDDFASAAGITKRTLYKYVDSKEKLVEKAILDYIQAIHNELRIRLEEFPDFLEGIDEIINIYPLLIKNMDSSIIKDIFNQYPKVEETVVREMDSFAKDIILYIQKAQRQGAINKKYDCRVILESMQALVIYFIKNQPDQVEEKLKKSISMMVYGLIS